MPALNLLCERKGIPEDVAGATLLAAGCNAPELFASLIGVTLPVALDPNPTNHSSPQNNPGPKPKPLKP